MINTTDLIEIANKIVVKGKGILAADESIGTIAKRFSKIKVENTEENRRKYRQLLFTSKDIENYISGVILFEESLNHKTDEGILFLDLLKSKNIIPGIKVDKGLKILSGEFHDEFVTQGIDDLDIRCKEYYTKGIRFAKWRAVFEIKDSSVPSQVQLDLKI